MVVMLLMFLHVSTLRRTEQAFISVGGSWKLCAVLCTIILNDALDGCYTFPRYNGFVAFVCDCFSIYGKPSSFLEI